MTLVARLVGGGNFEAATRLLRRPIPSDVEDAADQLRTALLGLARQRLIDFAEHLLTRIETDDVTPRWLTRFAATIAAVATQIDPGLATALLRRAGRGLLSCARLVEATWVFKAALALDPADPEDLRRYIACRRGLNDFTGATCWHRRVIQIIGDSDAGWAELGHLAFWSGDFPRAIAAFQRSLVLRPDQPLLRRQIHRAKDLRQVFQAGAALKSEMRLPAIIRPDRPTALPIVINSRDRLGCLQRLIDRLRADGCTDIWVIDNQSSYAPLLAWLDQLEARGGVRIVHLGANLGAYALWACGLAAAFQRADQSFVYTDPDVVPDDDCPSDYLAHFQAILAADPALGKVGFSLRTDDLPDHYPWRPAAIASENESLAHPYRDLGYRRAIDTTFALCRPNCPIVAQSVRTVVPYLARHLSWYLNPDALPADEAHYVAHSRRSDINWTKF